MERGIDHNVEGILGSWLSTGRSGCHPCSSQLLPSLPSLPTHLNSGGLGPERAPGRVIHPLLWRPLGPPLQARLGQLPVRLLVPQGRLHATDLVLRLRQLLGHLQWQDTGKLPDRPVQLGQRDGDTVGSVGTCRAPTENPCVFSWTSKVSVTGLQEHLATFIHSSR